MCQATVEGCPPCVTIGRRRVGRPNRAFIIAEAGVNHDGSVDKAQRLVDIAAGAGADAVKFQVFSADRLATADVAAADYQAREAGATSQREMLHGLELTDEDFAQIAARCHQRGIALLCTPFSVEDVHRVAALGCPAIKIASSDLVDSPLLEAAACSGRPLIVSTGAATAAEIEHAVEQLRHWGVKDCLVLMHCVSSYPTPLSEANLGAVRRLQGRFGVPAGFSDHTVELDAGALAVSAGACILEKHFTVSRSDRGPDHAMSLQADELAEYIRLALRAHQALGDGELKVQPIEQEVRALSRKRLVAARDIPRGGSIRRDDLRTKRASSGLLPTEADQILFKRATGPIAADSPILPEMVR